MTKAVNKGIILSFVLALLCFFAFGCEDKTIKVENIYVNTESGNEIVLLVGDTYSPSVSFYPTNPTNNGYSLYVDTNNSKNPTSVRIENNQVIALEKGSVVLQVCANENKLIKDFVTIQIVDTVNKLSAPSLTYNQQSQSFIINDANSNSVGYKLKIERENATPDVVTLGNVQTYTLADYQSYLNQNYSGVSAYDTRLSVQIKALSPTYSSAYQDSNYCDLSTSGLDIYQTSAVANMSIVGGELSFTANNSRTQLLFDNELYSTLTSQQVDLTQIDSTYAGKEIDVGLISVVDDSKKTSSTTTYYNSQISSINNVSVLGYTSAKMVGSTLSWDSVKNASSYKLTLSYDDVQITPPNLTSLRVNAYSFPNAEGTAPMQYQNGTEYSVIVIPQISATTKNVISTTGCGQALKFSRLAQATLTATDNQVTWPTIADARYVLKMYYFNDLYEKVELVPVVTSNTSFNLDEYDTGTYYLSLQAISTRVDGYYLDAPISELTITKGSVPVVELDDYCVKITATEIGEKYSISYEDANGIQDVVLTSTTENQILSLDLSSANFNIGENNVGVQRCGNGTNVFDSKFSVLYFRQLSAITAENISFANGKVTIDAEIEATIAIEVNGKTEKIQTREYTFNTTDTEGENYLTSGSYTLNVYVLGDGKTTFGYRELGNKQTISATANFSVLSVPTYIVEKTEPKFTINQVTDAVAYKIVNGDNNLEQTDVEYGFTLLSGESKTFTLQAIGSGNILDSAITAPFTIKRLATPTLTFDNTTNILSKQDTNESGEVASISFRYNEEDYSYDFATALSNLQVGDNTYQLSLIAQTSDTPYLVNSFATNITITKVNPTATLAIDDQNRLIISASQANQFVDKDTSKELQLSITFTNASSQSVEFVANANSELVTTTQDQGNLTYYYQNDNYIIPLLNNTYKNLINILSTETFSVSVGFTASHSSNDTMANNALQSTENFALAKKAMFKMEDRDAQNIVFENLDSKMISSYAMLLNDEQVITLDNAAIYDSEKAEYKLDIDYIYTRLQNVNDINSLCLITFNGNENTKLSRLGDTIYVTKPQAPTLQTTKDSYATDNSRYVFVETSATTFASTYAITLTDGANTKVLSPTIVDSKMSVKLDDNVADLGQIVYATAQLLTASSYIAEDKTIYTFNSSVSNQMSFTKAQAVQNVYTSGMYMYFTLVSGDIAGYDVYEVNEYGKTKLNTSIITSNTFNFKDYQGDHKIVIKTISNDENATNSDYSAEIDIHKLPTPVLTTNNGYIEISNIDSVLEFISNTTGSDENIDGAILRIVNGLNTYDLTINSTGVSVSGTKLVIFPSAVLTYGETSLLAETLNVQLVSSLTDSSKGYYIDSNVGEDVVVKGLLTSTGLKVEFNNQGIDQLSWQKNTANIENQEDYENGYVVIFVTEDGTQYSTQDTKLMYKANGTYHSYANVIDTNTMIFPEGYDIDEDGTISESELFVGTLTISLYSIPKTTTSANLCTSKMSNSIQVTLLAKPEFTVTNGQMNWVRDEDSTSYLVSIYSYDSSTGEFGSLLTTQTITEDYFDFSSSSFNDSATWSGMFGVSIKAQSTKYNTASSRESEILKIYRLNPASSLLTDDGTLILTATDYFTYATIDFVDNVNYTSTRIIYENDRYLIKSEEVQTKTEAQVVGDIATQNKHIIKINNDEILNLTSSRSYTINIKLIGNSKVDGAENQLILINSATETSMDNQIVTKLSTTIQEIESGVYKFDKDSNYKSSTLNLHYNFNNQTSENEFINTTTIYLLSMNVSNVMHDIYAIDYNDFIANKSMLTENVDYKIYQENENTYDLYAYVKVPYIEDSTTKYLYFNVYKNNIINLKANEHLYYFATTRTVNDCEYSYASESSVTDVNIGSGGTFIIKANILGGDTWINDAQTQEYRAYLTSNAPETKVFVRYEQNVLTTDQGIVILQDLLKYDVDEQVIDYPIYKLVIKNKSTNETKNVYLYYSNITAEDALAITNDADGLYLPALDTYDENESTLAFDMSNYFVAGAYDITIQTLAGAGVEGNEGINYLLDSSKPTTTYTFYQLTDSVASVENGKIKFDIGWIYQTEYVYSYDYEITIADENDTTVTYEIDQFDTNIEIFGGETPYCLYTLPDVISDGVNRITISNGKHYSIKVRAMAKNNSRVINACYPLENGGPKVLSFDVSAGIVDQSFKIVNGEIRWQNTDSTQANRVMLYFKYTENGTDYNTIRVEVEDNRVFNGTQYLYNAYSIKDTAYSVYGTATTTIIKPNVEYIVYAVMLGNSNSNSAIVNSRPTSQRTIQRLSTLDSSTIVATDGVLSWTAVENAIGYELTLVNEQNSSDTYTYTITNNELDLVQNPYDEQNLLPTGSYKVQIRALGNDYINAIVSNYSTGFKRLANVTDIGISSTNKNYISWDEVENAQGYKVVFSYGTNYALTSETTIEDGSTTQTTAPSEMYGAYKVTVSALGVGTSKVISGEATTFTSSSDRPQSVGEVVWDSDLHRYVISVSEDFTANDKIAISYEFTPYQANTSTVGYGLSQSAQTKDVTISYLQTDSYYEEEGNYYYIFTPSEMGTYTNLSVHVERLILSGTDSTLYSASVLCDDIDFNLFAYGDGTSTNPYAIFNFTQMQKIKYYTDKCFVVKDSIIITQTDIDSSLNSNNGAIVCETFTGELDADQNTLYLPSVINLTSATKFALFGSINGAKIKNMVVSSQNNSINIVNMFANNNQSVLKLSIVAGESTDSILQNVNCATTTITLSGAGTIKGKVYISSFIAYQATSTQFIGCSVNLIVDMQSSFTGETYIGALAGMAESSTVSSLVADTITNTTSQLKLIQAKTSNTLYCVGGLFGRSTSNTINSAEVGINQDSNIYVKYYGGVCGYDTLSTISGCTITGNFTHTSLNTASSYLGGVCGLAMSSTISSNTIELQFSVVRYASTAYVGAVTGYATTNANNVHCIIKDNTISYDFVTTTQYNDNEITIGLCGKSSQTNVEITNNIRGE